MDRGTLLGQELSAHLLFEAIVQRILRGFIEDEAAAEPVSKKARFHRFHSLDMAPPSDED